MKALGVLVVACVAGAFCGAIAGWISGSEHFAGMIDGGTSVLVVWCIKPEWMTSER